MTQGHDPLWDVAWVSNLQKKGLDSIESFSMQVLCRVGQVTKTNDLRQAGSVGSWWTHAPFKGQLSLLSCWNVG